MKYSAQIYRSISEGKYSFALMMALAALFWWPSLVERLNVVHGDSAFFSLSLLEILSEGIRGERDLLWESGIYGGHPLFAEGQGGFLNPFNVIAAILFPARYAIGVLFCLYLVLSGAGTYALCRIHHLSRWASTFGSITVSFSSMWLLDHSNLTWAATMATIPWMFASMEYWLDRPTLRRACLMATVASITTLSGYPQIAHGIAIYFVVYFLGLTLRRDGRDLLRPHAVKLALTGLFAVALTIGLSAAQLLPLVELALNSHRSNGVEVVFGGNTPALSYIRGMFFFDWNYDASIVFMHLSSASALLFVGAILLKRIPARLMSHALALLLLLNLGMEHASPLFTFIYEHKLIPGLHNYRVMHPFTLPAIVGIGLLSAFSLNAFANSPPRAGIFSLYLLLFAAATVALYHSTIPLENFLAPAIIIATLLGTYWRLPRSALPIIASLAIAADATAFRMNVFNFYDESVLEKTEGMESILRDTDTENYRSMEYFSPVSLVFMAPDSPNVRPAYRQALDTLTPLPSLLEGIPSINGTFALELARRTLIKGRLEAELSGNTATPPGRRLIDQLGVRYVSHNGAMKAAGLELVNTNTETGVSIYKNSHALPKFRTYGSATVADTKEQALALLTTGHSEALVVEGEPQNAHQSASCHSAPPHLNVRESTSTRYLLDVEASCPTWLFIGDAMYPGWTATVDDRIVKLHPAQILGKALQVPAGNHRVIVSYTPTNFRMAIAISAISIIILIATLGWPLAMRTRPYQMHTQ